MPSNERNEGKPAMNRCGFLIAAAGSAVATAINTASATMVVKARSITSTAEGSSSTSHRFDLPKGREDGTSAGR